MLVDNSGELEYKGLGLNSSGGREYNSEYLSLLYDLLTDERYLGFSACHICVTIDAGTPTSFYTRLFKSVFAGCVYVLKRENSAGSFDDNELMVSDSKGEHLHLFVIFPGDSSISTFSFTKRFKDLIPKVNRNKYIARRIRNFNIVNSKVKGWVWPEYLDKYDVWFDTLDERKEFAGVKKEVVIKRENLERVFRWASYLAKDETPTSKTQKVFFIRDLM